MSSKHRGHTTGASHVGNGEDFHRTQDGGISVARGATGDWSVIPPYDVSGVTDPTEAELAEIDAAMDQVDPAVVTTESMRDWAGNAKVKLAIRQVGLPDSTPDWIERFSLALFAITEATEKLGIDALLEAASEWDDFVNHPFDHSGPNGGAIIAKFLGAGMSIEAAAAYLGTTTEKVCGLLSTAHADTLQEADRLLRQRDVSMQEIERRTGISRERLRRHARSCNLVTASQRKWSTRADDALKARGMELHAQGGKSFAEIAHQLADEFPDAPQLTRHAIFKWVKRSAA